MHASRDDVDSNLLSTAPIVHAAVATNECMGHLPHNRSFTAHKLNWTAVRELHAAHDDLQNEETCLDAFVMKGLRKVLPVSWTAAKTNEWVLDKAKVKRELLDTVKARKLAYYGHTMRKQGSRLENEIMQGTMPGARRRGRPRTAWMDNIKKWTGPSVEDSTRITEDR